jgi:hypothetical protein
MEISKFKKTAEIVRTRHSDESAIKKRNLR